MMIQRYKINNEKHFFYSDSEETLFQSPGWSGAFLDKKVKQINTVQSFNCYYVM